MIETIVKVDGMMCGMCEGHINDAIRSHFPGEEGVLVPQQGPDGDPVPGALDQAQLRQVIDATGYKALDVVSRPVEKRGLLGRLKK